MLHRRCAWCRREMEETVNLPGDAVTDGICPRCRALSSIEGNILPLEKLRERVAAALDDKIVWVGEDKSTFDEEVRIKFEEIASKIRAEREGQEGRMAKK